MKSANRQYTSITNDYEMTFNNDTTVVPCEEEDESIPTMQFDFRTVSQLENMSKDTMLGKRRELLSETNLGDEMLVVDFCLLFYFSLICDNCKT